MFGEKLLLKNSNYIIKSTKNNVLEFDNTIWTGHFNNENFSIFCAAFGKTHLKISNCVFKELQFSKEINFWMIDDSVIQINSSYFS